MRQANVAIEEDLLDVALTDERSTDAKLASTELKGLVWTGVVTCLCLLATLIAVSEIFYWTLRSEIQRKQLAITNSVLIDTHAQEQARLTRYQWVKQNDGVLRIPLQRAKELVVADYAQAALSASAASALPSSGTRTASGGTSP